MKNGLFLLRNMSNNVSCNLSVKKIAENICCTEKNSNFVLGNHTFLVVFVMITQTLKTQITKSTNYYYRYVYYEEDYHLPYGYGRFDFRLWPTELWEYRRQGFCTVDGKCWRCVARCEMLKIKRVDNIECFCSFFCLFID